MHDNIYDDNMIHDANICVINRLVVSSFSKISSDHLTLTPWWPKVISSNEKKKKKRCLCFYVDAKWG